MSKTKFAVAGDLAVQIPAETRKWANSHGTFIAGRAYVDEADHTAAQMEAKWGCGRLRLLVSPELRERYDRQRYLLNQAIWHGELEDVRTQAGRMVKAWLFLDQAATQAGHGPLPPQVWEIAMADGTVAAIVPDNQHAALVNAQGRAVSVYTLDEIGRVLSSFAGVAKAKAVFPGAEVVAVRRTVGDPLDEVDDTDRDLDDHIPF